MTDNLQLTIERGHGGVVLVTLTDRSGLMVCGDGLTVRTALRNAERKLAHVRECRAKGKAPSP